MDPTIGMLLELVKLGPLDQYLRESGQIVKVVDLVEATTCLATALWHLVGLLRILFSCNLATCTKAKKLNFDK